LGAAFPSCINLPKERALSPQRDVWLRRSIGMPFVVVNMWPGRDDVAKRRIVEGITKVLEKERIPRTAISVILNEIPKNNWAEAGKLCSDRE
jgi:4-oxalocrotonate tautomerase